MLWRLLWSLSRGVRPLGGGGGGGGGGTAAGLSRPRPVAPALPHEEEPRGALGNSSSSGSWHGKHQQHKGCGCGNFLHRYSPWDAFTWGALAVLAVELAKQVRWLSSAKANREGARLCQLEGRLAVLPPHQHSVSPTPPSVYSVEKKEPLFVLGKDSEHVLENPSPAQTSQKEEDELLSEKGCFLFPPSTDLDPDSRPLHSQGKTEQEASFDEAASQLQHTFQASVSVAFNILGLEHVQNGQYKMAFSCFKLAADRNYSKAQFNVGMCYEHGRGTEKDMIQAVFYYRQAAQQGHTLAQYHYAKWLLRHWPRVDDSSIQEAVCFLDKAATGGLTQAQAYLGVLYVKKGLESGKQSALKYLHMAATNGDSPSRFHLGVCYEKGFGVPKNLLEAWKHYQQAAAAGYKPAQERIQAMTQEETAAISSWHKFPSAIRTFSSSPCLQNLEQPFASRLEQPAHGLLHSWSTGNLGTYQIAV